MHCCQFSAVISRSVISMGKNDYKGKSPRNAVFTYHGRLTRAHGQDARGTTCYNPYSFHFLSTNSFVAASISISRGHARTFPSPLHLALAPKQLLLPAPSTRAAQTTLSTGLSIV